MIKRLFMNQSIRAKIVWSTVLISLVPLLVLSYLFYQNSTRSLEQAMVRSSDQNAEYLSDYLNEYFRSFSTSALQVYGFKRVIDLMEYGTNYNVADIIDVRESLASYYRLAVSNNADIIKIMVYGSDNTLRDSWSRADSYNAIALNQTTPHYGDIVKLPFQHSLMFTYQDPAIKQDLFVYALPIYDPFYREKFGTLLFYVLGKDLAKKVETYNRAPNVIVLQNGKGEAFYRTNPNYDAEIQPYRLPDELSDSNEQVLQFTEGRELLISTSPLDHGNIGLSIVYPSTELAHNRKTTLSITIAALALVMLVIAAFSLLAQQFITRPIQYLGKAMKAVRKGNFDVVLPTNRWHDDLSELTASFNFMTRTIQELIEKEYKLQLRNKEAQFLALQMQINPHFLYNTLQTIGGKAVLAGDYEIHEMCRALGDIFRYSFYEGNMESTIGAELAHLNNYLYIQQFRFEESLKTRFDVQSELMDAPIIRFVLQPILENIMVHALGKDRRSTVQIEVSAQREDGHIRISISDDGPGMEPDKLKALRAVLARPASKVFSGVSIGLRNVHERIRLFYGPPYGLEIDTWPLPDIEKKNPELYNNDLGYFPYPFSNDENANKLDFNADASLAIGSKTKHKEAALKFLEFMSSKEGGDAWVENIKSLSYVKGTSTDIAPALKDLQPYFDNGQTYDSQLYLAKTTIDWRSQFDQNLQKLFFNKTTMDQILADMDDWVSKNHK